jgi:hypothetical protein
MRITKNNRAMTAIQGIIVAAIIIILIVAGAYVASQPTATTDPKSEIQVWIDTVEQGNLTTTQPLSWGNPLLGNTYTRNFTVYNRGNQTLNIALVTTEPQGWTSAWPANNTALPPFNTVQGNLAVTLSNLAGQGTYMWILHATNGSLPTPTPSTTPTETPTAQYNCTIKTNGVGLNTIKISQVGTMGAITLTQTDIGTAGYNLTFTVGASLKFETTTIEGYTFNAYTFSDGTFPQSTPTFTATATAPFTITANFLLTPESTPTE